MDFRSLPPFARAQFEATFTRRREQSDHARDASPPLAPSSPPSRLEGVPAGAVFALAAVLALAGCSSSSPSSSTVMAPKPRGEECVRYCHPLPLLRIQEFYGYCVCGEGPVCAKGGALTLAPEARP